VLRRNTQPQKRIVTGGYNHCLSQCAEKMISCILYVVCVGKQLHR